LIWLHRNVVIFGKEFMSSPQVVRSAAKSMATFKSVANQEQRPQRQGGPNVKQWKPLDMGCLKLNWDDAICYLTKKMGVGAALQDEHWAVAVALASVIPYIRDPFVVEANSFMEDSVILQGDGLLTSGIWGRFPAGGASSVQRSGLE